MRSHHLSRILVSLALLACGCATTPSLPPRGNLGMRDVGFPLRSMRLPSGLRVIVEEDKRAPVVGVITVVDVGAASDPAGKEGLAHFVEHLTFRSRPNTRTSVWRQLEQIGVGGFNAETSLDTTLYYEITTKEKLGKVLALEGDRILSPITSVDPAVFDVEREVVRNELRLRNEMGFQGQAFSWLQEAVFPQGHPYARPIAGTHASLSAITYADAQAFVRQHYKPENMTLVIIGDVDLKTVDQIINQSFPSGLTLGANGGPQPPRLSQVAPEPPAPPTTPLARHEGPVPTPEIWIGWSLPRSFDAAHHIQQFAFESARRHVSGAYWEDNDIAGLSFDLVPGKEASLMLCRVTLRNGTNPERSLDHVLNQLVEMWIPATSGTAQTMVDVDFSRQRMGAVTGLALDAENILERGRLRAEFTHYSGDPTVYSRSLKAIGQLEASAVAQFAQKYLNRERARAVYIAPLPGTAQALVATSPLMAPLGDETVYPPAPEAIRATARGPGVSDFQQLTLPNGVEVIAGRRPGLPLVSVGLALRGGWDASTPAGTEEMASMVTTRGAIFNGRPSDYGVHSGENYTRDNLKYVMSGGSGNFTALVAMMAEQAQSRKPEEAALVHVDRELLPVLKKYEERPEAVANRAFWSALYEGHPYGHEGTVDEMGSVTVNDLRDWIARTHTPKNAVVAVVGEIEPAAVLDQVAQWFGTWQGTGEKLPPPPAPTSTASGAKVIVTHRPGATQGEVQIGCLLPSADAKATVRNQVMAELATERLTKEMRHEIGASYGFGSQADTLRGGSAYLLFQGNVDNQNLPRALAALDQTITTLDQKVTADEVERAKWQLANRAAVARRTNASMVDALLEARTKDWPIEWLDAYPDHLAAVALPDVKSGFAACAAGRRVISIVGDEATVKAALPAAWK